MSFQQDAFQHDAFQVALPDGGAAADPFIDMLHRIEHGMVAITAACMDGVIEAR